MLYQRLSRGWKDEHRSLGDSGSMRSRSKSANSSIWACSRTEAPPRRVRSTGFMGMGNFSLRLTHKITAIAIIGVIGVVLIGGIHLYGESAMAVYRDEADNMRTIFEL